MKSIISIGLGILMTASIFSGIPFSNHANTSVIRLVCTDPDPDENSMQQSGAIIEKRLEGSGVQNLSVDVSNSEKLISIQFNDKFPLAEVTEIATAKGELAFYETVRDQDDINQLQMNKPLASLLQFSGRETQSPDHFPTAEVGKCRTADMGRVEKILSGMDRISEDPVCYMWSTFPDENGYYTLYILKDEPMLSGKYISDSNISNMPGRPVSIMVNFSKEGSEQWEALTGRNINKPLALVMDNRVIFAPVVRDAIRGGKCMITGNFTQEEANRINVLIKYGELPLEFKVEE